MQFKDYYQILGVDKQASTDDIKKAYRKLARKYHPDVSKETDAEARMRELNEARDVLTDPEKRAAYDQLGQGYRAGEDFQPPPDWGAYQSQGFDTGPQGFSGADFSDFFENLFGGGHRQQDFRRRGEDRHASVTIELADTYQGTTQTLNLASREMDPHGRVVTREHALKVKIPKGVREGQHIRLAGKGAPGLGGAEPGDLYLEIHFKADPRLRVEGRDVYQTLPVTPWEAALGGAIEVHTPGGPVKLTLPANSQSGRKLRLKGRGIPAREPGDLYIVLEVMTPPADTERAREIYRTMRDEMHFNPRQTTAQGRT